MAQPAKAKDPAPKPVPIKITWNGTSYDYDPVESNTDNDGIVQFIADRDCRVWTYNKKMALFNAFKGEQTDWVFCNEGEYNYFKFSCKDSIVTIAATNVGAPAPFRKKPAPPSRVGGTIHVGSG